jgi:S-formylglutathione hydrolase FrmB
MKSTITLSSLFVILALLCNPLGLTAQHGTVDNSQSVQSEILDRDMSYSVYLPESYEESTRHYPVLYLLHGMTGDHNDWITVGEVQRIAGMAMAEGTAPEMIIIMPDGLYDSFYINNYDGSVRWEEFFHTELIPDVEQRYRIINDRSSRAIAGLSMGGYGAMYHGVKYRETFSHVYAMSAAFLEVEPMPIEERSDWDRDFHQKTWGPYNENGLPENYKEHSVQEMFKAMDPIEPSQDGWNSNAAEEPPLPGIFIDCGDDDFLIQQNMNLAEIMNEKNVDFEFRIRDGGHTWHYWRTALANAMAVIGDHFRN